MSIKFHNTLTKNLDEFVPLEKNTVKIYTCGPTVYDYAHIGNLRAYIFEDILRRYLKYRGFRVVQVMNLTDVDDKTIRNSRANNVKLSDWTEKFKKAFFEDIKTLNIEPAEFYPEATKHIPEMVALIKKLMEKGFCYTSEGSIYFSISKFKSYGKLSGFKIDELKPYASGRIRSDEYEKENVSDFVLWKTYNEDDGDVFWETELGKGRPGWHIECSAMSMKYLGETFDIHTGGVDNIFPHHENEIAQSEAATGKKFANYWIHCAHLIVDGEKMSKSKGNFFTLRDLLSKGYSPKAIRYLLLSTHYRKQLNFTKESLQAAHTAIEKIQNFYNILLDTKTYNLSDREFEQTMNNLVEQFNSNLDDDLNISGALGHFFDLMTETNKCITQNSLTENNKNKLISVVNKINTILNILEEPQKELSEEIKKLIEEREKARKEKNFKLSDQLRDQLKEKGVIVEDTKEGIRWKILK